MSLGKIFAENGVQCAHIIDDAYNKEPNLKLPPGKVQAFIDALEDAHFDFVCNLLEMKEADDAILMNALGDTDSVTKIFNARGELEPSHFNQLFDEYLVEQEAKLAQVKPLTELLQSYGIDCQTFGADYSLDSSNEPQLIFIDLRLREEGPVQVDDAIAAYNKLRNTHQDCLPFVFLMSSLPTALTERREEFRKQSNLFASQFEALEKSNFQDKTDLEAILAQYVRVLPQLRNLHQHVGGISLAVDQAAEQVKRELRNLDLADYFVLHRNTVSIEKVGLGTYISDLILEYFVHELENTSQIWDLAKALDDWKLEDLPRSRFGLTPAAGNIYSGNLLHATVRLESEIDRKLGPKDGYFYLGDIFFNGEYQSKALVIATPACDLVRPDELRKRTIFLCEGSVKSVTAASVPAGQDGLASVVIQDPKDTTKQLMINWNKKRLHTWHAEEIDKFKEDKSDWIRVGRLRPLYAIQLQHAITADLSRIGVQRPPNILIPHGIEAFVRHNGKWKTLYGEERVVATAAALADSEDGKKTVFIISDSTVRKIRRKLLKWLENNPQELLTKIVQLPDFDNRLMYLEHKVPQKDQSGKDIDITGYAMQGAEGFTAEEVKAIALTRPAKPSLYLNVAGGNSISDEQSASLVIKFIKID
ncbi:hypothetical protein CWO84_23800 [Methylomonas sp. Kb3]|uniref:hypothetical protein n=1 Tax=Methylomonas sp. Kb3 TaxID=1611544 RepID=UPI000C34AC74|nr:hypothetical protein [Methylomonas sp. Kb3]PKD38236.1 hypothetical protein CWO84_23800 [Methylomonas sp. Kb3]